ncbi:MAG: hypothetical protein R3251_00650 [Candidatus Spechtbacterales bacterium]|nr:hypothetical protein [Candidatus Spechtbacterales bacterium]
MLLFIFLANWLIIHLYLGTLTVLEILLWWLATVAVSKIESKALEGVSEEIVEWGGNIAIAFFPTSRWGDVIIYAFTGIAALLGLGGLVLQLAFGYWLLNVFSSVAVSVWQFVGLIALEFGVVYLPLVGIVKLLRSRGF